MDDRMIATEERFWREFVRSRIPKAYAGIRELMEAQKAQGGFTAVISHSHRENILRDYAGNGLPEPDLVFGWEMPPEKRKPASWPLQEVLRRFSLRPEETLMIDDLKPGYDMARACGVPFAAVGWSNDIPEIEAFMRENCGLYFKRVSELREYLFGTEEKGEA